MKLQNNTPANIFVFSSYQGPCLSPYRTGAKLRVKYSNPELCVQKFILIFESQGFRGLLLKLNKTEDPSVPGCPPRLIKGIFEAYGTKRSQKRT